MHRIVFNESTRFGTWALAQIGYPESWGPWYQAIGLESDGVETDGWSGRGRILAAVVFTDFAPEVSLTMHVAARGRYWATPAFTRACFRYAFVQCRVKRVTAYVATRNTRCRNLVEHLGFVQEGVMRAALPGDDAVIYGLLAEEANRWLN